MRFSLRVRTNHWQVLTLTEGQWVTAYDGTRACDAFRTYGDLNGEARRLLRNGKDTSQPAPSTQLTLELTP